MDVCKMIMGEARGTQMRTLVEDLTGEPCPCSTGQTCPLIGALGVPQPRFARVS